MFTGSHWSDWHDQLLIVYEFYEYLFFCNAGAQGNSSAPMNIVFPPISLGSESKFESADSTSDTTNYNHTGCVNYDVCYLLEWYGCYCCWFV